MLEGKWPSLIVMAGEAAALVGGHFPHHSRPEGSVWIVAIHARHRPFGQSVPVRAMELAPYIDVTTRALLIRFAAFRCDQTVRSSFMDWMASNAAHQVVRMTVLDTPDLCR